MLTTISILGAGELGGSVAHALARRQSARRVRIIDPAAGAAAGKALDIQQSGPIEGFHTRLEGTDDVTRITGSAVCIVADRFGAASPEWQGEDGLAQLTRVAPYIGDAVVLFAGGAQSDLMAKAATEAGLRRERIVGSAAEAFAAAVRAIVAMEARCSPSEVMLTVLGAPPQFVMVWSEASIGGYALERVLTPVQVTRIEARAARLWPPGAYTLGLAAALVTDAVLTASRRTLSVLTLLGGEFGVRNRIGAVPALLAPHGVAHVRVPLLSTRDRVLVETALGA
jgi:malate dehydrogenase